MTRLDNRRFKDDAGRDSQKPAKQAKRAKKQHDEDEGNADEDRSDAVEENASGTEAGKESWPGPWSTASDLYRKRDAAAQKRKQGPAVESAPTVVWVPMAMLQPRKTPPKAVPSLQDICLDFLATHIEACLESGLGGILPEMKAKLCQELCRRRKLLPEVLPIFTEVGDTSVLHLPDCSYLGEKDLAQAVERIKGPNLDEFSLKYCGRGMSDKLIEDLCQECPNITVLALGGCYRVTDKGIAGRL